MKFDSKKIALFFIIFLFISPINAMDAPKKELTQLSPEELKEYKDKLYVQFCAAQEVKKKFFEVLQTEWEYALQVTDHDEFVPSQENESAVILFQTSVSLPIGKWHFARHHSSTSISSFARHHSSTSISSEESFYQNFFSLINAQFYRSNTHRGNRNPSRSYYSYKIGKTANGSLVPELEKFQLTQEQAQAFWKELNNRYAEEKAKGKIS